VADLLSGPGSQLGGLSSSRWILDAQEATRVVFPLDAAHALEAGSAGMLQAMHPDPFDRLIVAAVLSAKAQLTAQRAIVAVST